MIKFNDGGPDFPTLDYTRQTDPSKSAYFPGMTLRDYFAGQALPAIIAATSAGQHQPQMRDGEQHIRFAIARDAYEMADAMLKAREGG